MRKLLLLVSLTLLPASAQAQLQFQQKTLSPLNADSKTIKEGIRRFYNKMALFKMEKGLEVAQFPLLVAQSPTLTVFIHPEFITTVVFPKGWKVVKAESSAPVKMFSYYDNILLIQPKPSFPQFNAVVLLKTPGGVKLQNIVYKLVNPYDDKESVNRLFLTVMVAGGDALSPVTVLEDYRRTHGRLPASPVRFLDGGQIYRILPDPFGNVEVGGRRFFVFVDNRP